MSAYTTGRDVLPPKGHGRPNTRRVSGPVSRSSSLSLFILAGANIVAHPIMAAAYYAGFHPNGADWMGLLAVGGLLGLGAHKVWKDATRPITRKANAYKPSAKNSL